jgi:hypothetical protein
MPVKKLPSLISAQAVGTATLPSRLPEIGA